MSCVYFEGWYHGCYAKAEDWYTDTMDKENLFDNKSTITITDKNGKLYTLKKGDRFIAKDKISCEEYEYTGIIRGYEYCLRNINHPNDYCDTWITNSWWGQRDIRTKGE